MIRSHPITSRPLALQGIRLTECAIQQRSDQFLSELKSELPCLQCLRRSEITISYLPTDKELLWVATLCEFDPFPLFPTNHSSDQDLFLLDVRTLEAEKRSLPSRIIEATSAATASKSPSSTSKLRSALKAKQTRWVRKHLSNEEFYQSLLVEETLPKVLPTSENCIATFKIESLNRRYAEIILSSNITSNLETEKFIKRGTEWQLKRSHPFNSAQYGAILQNAMDKKLDVKAELAIVLAWEDSRPIYLELQKILD